MPVDDADLLAVRSTPKYRAGIWFARVANLVVLPGLVLVVAGVLPRSAFTYLWAFGLVTLGTAVLLLFTSGIKFERYGVRWLAEREAGRMIVRDLFWMRRSS